ALVFPVIASFYWGRVTNLAFTAGALSAVAIFVPVRFELLPMTGLVALGVDVLSVIGVGVVLGLMCFGFFGLRVAVSVGAVATVDVAPFGIGLFHDYTVLGASLLAYAVSTLVCCGLTRRNRERYDLCLIAERTG